ncbi:hypothetical protein [Moritella sp.]|uniref:hypothetical protein n=1 Tax=Moritella sp. TaxID=78556 RepID=UPI001D606E68|nr:hypothetical protein [Moritella sp.]MCJ8352107.1 hypothetical protein [Moritella sp.]NQZ42213.1 hypothetical protein [Moritella sp.]
MMNSNTALQLESPLSYKSWKKYARNQKKYIQEVMMPVIASGDWNAIEDLPIIIGENGEVLLRFSDDIWPLKDILTKSEIEDKHLANIHFYAYEKPGRQVDAGFILPRRMKNELKCFALSDMFFQRKPTENLATIVGTINPLKFVIIAAVELNMSSFSEVTTDVLRMMLDLGHMGLKKKTLSSLNRFSRLDLPINFKDIGKFTVALFPEANDIRDGEQNAVIPLKVYRLLISEAEAEVNKYYKVRDELAAKIRRIQKLQLSTQARMINAIRTGKGQFPAYLTKRSVQTLEESFAEAGIEVADNHRYGKEWIELFDKLDLTFHAFNIKSHPTENTVHESYELEISIEYYKSITEFKGVLAKIDGGCRFLIQAYSGMRTDELYRIHPIYGLQTATIKGQKIYLLTTRQSKIKKGTNTINDVYVTTAVGARAYQLLNAIHTPLREQFKSDKNKFFGGFKSLLKHRPQQKDTANINKWVRKTLDKHEYKLDSEDIRQLDLSNPDRTTNLTEGEQYKFNPHQLRRSLAFYLIGYELLTYPMLKQQFSHFSLAMTRWYARNASSFAKMHREIENERADQKSEIIARIYNKIANKERLGGGKTKAVMDNLAKNGKSYYEEGNGDRVFSKAYWKQMLNSGNAHMHAIAPNMYCTNGNCSLRISVDLSDCIDCGFDFFEFGTYAEQVRQEMMRDLLLAQEYDEVSVSLVTRCVVQIRAAEKIMTDMDMKFEKFAVPEDMEKLIIPVTVVV